MNDLRAILTAIADDIAEYARQIQSGNYPTEYVIWRESPDNVGDTIAGEIWTTKESDAIAAWENAGNTFTDSHYVTENDADNEPTIRDNYGNASPISERPLEIVDERGRAFAIVLTTGGPHIEITADGQRDTRLIGYWGGETVTLYDDTAGSFATVLDYFIDRD